MHEFEQELRRKYPVCKDIGSLRARKVWLEDIEDAIVEIVERMGEQWTIEDSSEGRVYHVLRLSDRVGIYSASYRLGIPTVIVGTKSQEEWEEIRNELRRRGLVR